MALDDLLSRLWRRRRCISRQAGLCHSVLDAVTTATATATASLTPDVNSGRPLGGEQKAGEEENWRASLGKRGAVKDCAVPSAVTVISTQYSVCAMAAKQTHASSRLRILRLINVDLNQSTGR